MSRKTIYFDKRLQVVSGTDPIAGLFYQIFDKNMENETPEGEGLVLDWSINFGFKTNLTGYPQNLGLTGIVEEYVTANSDMSGEVEMDELSKNL